MSIVSATHRAVRLLYRPQAHLQGNFVGPRVMRQALVARPIIHGEVIREAFSYPYRQSPALAYSPLRFGSCNTSFETLS